MQLLVEILSTVGEFAIAIAIVWEYESNRLDRFLVDAFDQEYWKERREVFQAYCEFHIKNHENASFLEHLRSHEELRHKCDRQIALFNSLGSRLPQIPWFRAKAIQWFPQSVIFLWAIVYPYLEERRRNAGEHWATAFEMFAFEGARYLKKKGILNPVLFDSSGHRNIPFEIGKLPLIGAKIQT